ncbi:hypothetical protein EC973_007458 [Apophysomyces ossiformis]|uniref:Uncharacterized protein n=1 Tax=Apophysomyces ossiformis TaxID=679940 RepID=A0A8H7BPN6_9FUNG|nr:hypothetical protein EC973_007458 [Apophysomyces ossiformis]
MSPHTFLNTTNTHNNKKKKTVRFSAIHLVRYTHSATDYDRSCFANQPPIETFRPHLPAPKPCLPLPSRNQGGRAQIKPLDLSVIPNAARRSLEQTKKPKPPKLQIDTHGPLFLTALSTNYRCFSEEEEDDTGFLTPLLTRATLA